MHFGQAQLFFYSILVLLQSVAPFPFLQEVGTDQQQQQQPSLFTQNGPKEKQPILVSVEKGPSGMDVQKEELQSAKIAEKVEPESGEETEQQVVDLGKVIGQIQDVESFHEQLELKKEEGGMEAQSPAMLGQMGASGSSADSTTTMETHGVGWMSTTEMPTKVEEEKKEEEMATQTTQMTTFLLPAESRKEKEEFLVTSTQPSLARNGGAALLNISRGIDHLEDAEKDSPRVKGEEEEGKEKAKVNDTTKLTTAARLESDKKISSAQEEERDEEVDIKVPPALDRFLGQRIEGEEEEDGEEQMEGMTLWEKIVLGLRCARQDCGETLISGEEPQRLIKGWKITRRARRSTELAGGHRQFVCACKNTPILL